MNQKNCFFKKKKKTYFLRLLSAFKKIFGFNNGQIFLRRWIPNGIALFKTRVLNKCSWDQKRRVKKFFDFERIWKTQQRIKFRFIQEPWIYLFVKSQNSQIFYIINIMNFSKFAQEIYSYWLVASSYLIPSKSKIFIHSSWLPCPNEWFQVELFWRNYNEKLHFRI